MRFESPDSEKPSCLQTTKASGWFQELSHTVPHFPPMQISTRPSYLEVPLTRRMFPSVQFPAAQREIIKEVKTM